MVRLLTLTLVLGPGLLPSAALSAAENLSVVGRRVEDFTLRDFLGKSHQLKDAEGQKLVVIAFLGTECPLAKLYAPRLAELAEDFGQQGVAFLGINSNTQDSMTELAAYARTYGFGFPLLKDVGNRVADQLGAIRTPEVFVLDQQRVVRYWGRIDDQYGVGYIRDEPTRHDLRIAIEELLAGKNVSQPVATSVGCYIGRVREPQQDAEVTYSNQISRIFQQRCVECHRDGEIAPFALQDYHEVVGWAETIAEVIHDQRMPPWHANPQYGDFTNDRHLTAEELRLIDDWVEAGAPEGDRSQLPERPMFHAGWQLPKPADQVVTMAEIPFEVPAEGAVRYQYFSVDPGFTEDKWVQAIEVVPGNRSVVHHILVFAIPSGGPRRDFGGGVNGFLAGYVPGLRATPFPTGMAKRIPAGSRLLFQLHYTPIGSVQKDLSKIGFVFADPADVTHEVRTISAFQQFINIPRNSGNHEERTKTRIHEDSQLLAMMPHMHLRGKSFTYQLRLPGSDQWQTLLEVPRYDFNWQTNYLLREPIDLPKDAHIRCVAHFDNSADNVSNPDPNAKVRWGEQTWEDMLIGYFDVAVPYDHNTKPQPRDAARDRAEQYILQLDKNDDDKLQTKELPLRMRMLFGRSDKDRDGVISVDELVKALNRRS